MSEQSLRKGEEYLHLYVRRVEDEKGEWSIFKIAYRQICKLLSL